MDKVEVMLGADTRECQKALKEVRKDAENTAKASEKAFKKADEEATKVWEKRGKAVESAAKRESGLLGELRSQVLGYIAAVASIKTFANAFSFAAELKDDAEAYNTNVESLQTLREVARDCGGSADALNKGLLKLQQTTVEAANGNEKYSKTFATLGLNAEDLLKLPLEKQLEVLAKAYVSSGMGAESYNAVLEILGTKTGPRLIGTLRALAEDGFSGLNEAMKESGRIVAEETIDRLDRSQKVAEKTVSKLKTQFVSGVGEMITVAQGFGRTFSQIWNGKEVKNPLGNYGDIIHEDALTVANERSSQERMRMQAAESEAARREDERWAKELEDVEKKKNENLKKLQAEHLASKKRKEENARREEKKAQEKAAKDAAQAEKEKADYYAEYEKLRDEAIKARVESLEELSQKEGDAQKDRLDAEREITKELRGQLELRARITKEIAESGKNNGTGDARAAQRIEGLRDRADDAAAGGNFNRAARLSALAAQREEKLFDIRRERFNDAYKNERDPNRRAQMLEEGRRQGFDKDYKSLKNVQEREKREKEEQGRMTKDEKDKMLENIRKLKEYTETLAQYINDASAEIEANTKKDAGTGNVKGPKRPTRPVKPS